MQLADLMSTDVLMVSPDTTIGDAARRMIARDTGAAVVIENGDLVGLISERDLMRAIPDACSPETTVSERMSRHVMTASPGTSAPEAMAIMVGPFRHLPVVDGGRVLGIVSMRDLMTWTSLRLRLGPLGDADEEIDSAELLATIHRMRTGAA